MLTYRMISDLKRLVKREDVKANKSYWQELQRELEQLAVEKASNEH